VEGAKRVGVGPWWQGAGCENHHLQPTASPHLVAEPAVDQGDVREGQPDAVTANRRPEIRPRRPPQRPREAPGAAREQARPGAAAPPPRPSCPASCSGAAAAAAAARSAGWGAHEGRYAPPAPATAACMQLQVQAARIGDQQA
jgi:hypothetical protein